MNRILVNPALLTWARERAGLDALALARRFPRLTKCEDGQLPTHSDRRPHRTGHGSLRSVFTPAISKTDRARARIPHPCRLARHAPAQTHLRRTASEGREAISERARVMRYDLTRHHRRSIRLTGYDYSRAGAYFVTICMQQKECLFGDVVDGAMQSSEAGLMAEHWWLNYR